MSILQINLGTHPNDGTGDDLRTAFQKVNYNNDYLNVIKIENGANSGVGAPVFLEKSNKNLVFRTITSANSNMGISFDTSKIILDVEDSINSLVEDTNPSLGGNLDLNNYDIVGVGNIAISGNILNANTFIGNLTGNVTGNLTGNVTGQVSNIANHSLSDLNDISPQVPTVGQSLTWDGFDWTPQTIVSGVSKIISGSNISISPLSGVGEVTISSIGGVGGNLDFGTFNTPSGFTLDLGSFV